jgi:hypothetical protein
MYVPKLLERLQAAITALEMHAEVFPTWNETAGIQAWIACANPLPPPLSLSLAVRYVTKRKWRLRSRKRFVCCSLRSMNLLFLFSGNSGDNFIMFPHMPTALGVSISSVRQRCAFVKRKEQDVRVSEESVERVRQTLFRSPKKSVRHASRELDMSTECK